MLEILVVDAEHPDEYPAGEACDELHQLLERHPLPGVTSIIGNDLAYNAGLLPDGRRRRELQTNLALALPNLYGNGEEQRKYELLTQIFPKYDLVLARHGNGGTDLEFGFCHPTATAIVWDAIAVLGLERVLHCNHPVVSSLSPNYLGIDLGPNSGLTAPALWDKLAELSSAKKITPLPLAQYVHTGSISPMAAERAGMPDELAPFTPFTDTAIHRLGLRAGAVALHASSTAYDHTGHRTEILMPL